jgi:hypothetical protein
MHGPLGGDEDQGAGADCGMTADGVPAQPVNTGNLRSLPKASLPRGLPPPDPNGLAFAASTTFDNAATGRDVMVVVTYVT